jgi:type I restriction enzyme S subunit
MSKIEELIQQLCPDGVEFNELGKLGDFYGGLTGKSKNDFQGGNAKFITYMNVFSNISLKTDIDVFVKIGEKEKQNRVEYGDVLFTGSSETPDECGMSSVLTEKIIEPLYLNSFCFGFRLHDKDLFLPDFLKYLFRIDSLRKQIAQTASGVTRFNVSKKRFEKVIIPIPPLPVQQEIVNILDKFTQLEAELEAELETELEARHTQYNYYRDQLLSFEGKEVEWKTLEEVCLSISAGGDLPENYSKGQMKPTDEFPYPIFANATELNGLYGYTDNYKIESDAVTISARGAKIGFHTVREAKFTPIIRLITLVPNKQILTTKYLNYILDMTPIAGTKGGIPQLTVPTVKKISIPIPPMEEQERIVNILDKFDALVNDISVGLPAEIEARRKQYEYYREKLLTFKEAANG